MDSDDLNSMTAQIINGVPKEQSPYTADPEASDLWDRISAEVAAHPERQYHIPHEIPDVPDPQDIAPASGPSDDSVPPEQDDLADHGDGTEQQIEQLLPDDPEQAREILVDLLQDIDDEPNH